LNYGTPALKKKLDPKTAGGGKHLLSFYRGERTGGVRGQSKETYPHTSSETNKKDVKLKNYQGQRGASTTLK